MAVEPGSAVAVTDSAAVLLSGAAPANTHHSVNIVHASGDTIWVGGTDAVTDGAGAFPLTVGGVIAGDLPPNEALWGICASGESATFNKLHTGV